MYIPLFSSSVELHLNFPFTLVLSVGESEFYIPIGNNLMQLEATQSKLDPEWWEWQCIYSDYDLMENDTM